MVLTGKKRWKNPQEEEDPCRTDRQSADVASTEQNDRNTVYRFH